MKVGVICSAGGSAFLAGVEILISANMLNIDDIKLVSDRECNAVSISSKFGIKSIVHEYNDVENFSSKAFDEFYGFDIVFLFYSRVVGATLFQNIPTINIHPSLLPGLPGLRAMEKMFEAGSKFLAASAHIVTEKIDSGPIVGQITTPLQFGADILRAQSISFAQKVFLFTCCVDLLKNNIISFNGNFDNYIINKELKLSYSCNPLFHSSSLRDAFHYFLNKNCIKDISI